MVVFLYKSGVNEISKPDWSLAWIVVNNSECLKSFSDMNVYSLLQRTNILHARRALVLKNKCQR